MPEFYLKHWAHDGKIRVTHVDDGRSWITTPNKAAFETDYYRVDSPEVDPEEVPPLLFETALSKIEQWGVQVINAAVVDPEIKIEDENRVLFSLYMTSSGGLDRPKTSLIGQLSAELQTARQCGLACS